MSAASTPVSGETATPDRSYTLRQRFALALITWSASLLIRLIGPTLRFAASYEEGAPDNLESRPVIAVFWHRSMIAATYAWRNLQYRVMTSRSYDGEYISRIIQKFGFVAVRGSSSRGGTRAMLSMQREVEQGWSAAITPDGPRGPRYQAKPGPVFLSRSTGAPIVPFYVAIQDAWVLNTWDRFMVPKPFSRVLIRVARNITVPADVDDAGMQRYQQELQAALDRVTEFAEANVHLAGTEFPVFRRRAWHHAVRPQTR